MKKLVSVLIGLVIVSVAATSVSAADYEVKKGDSLWEIANENKTTVEILMEINELESSLIYPNQVLKLVQKEAEYYMVQEGDTLTHISNAYGADVTVGKLKEWNGLSSNLIITGQSLSVNGMGAELTATKAVEQTVEEEVVEQETEVETTASSVEVSEPVEEPADAEPSEEKVESTEKVEETTTEEVKGRSFSVESTAYTAGCSGCSGITATGINLNNDPYAKVIAVDPNVIPLGTEVYVEGYGYAVAGDTGGAIKGNKIDIHLPTKDEAYNWGRKTVNITIIE
ncbi:3D domain-containing protein [Oceanobacillus rekensis]|uniref:3D domain-containing protein n=1 Tax=Oceanobacillus rekensis TaxID=937927 RepID=UPI000B44C607|nr:3D domain-containing protein [Oceanobacillus rekensis]